MKDQQMIRLMKEHNEDAFEYCYYEYRQIVFFVIVKITKSRELAEEVLQDTFMKMYQSIGSFDGRYFKAWLLTIAKNLALNEMKKKTADVVYEDYLVIDELTSSQKTKELLVELESILDKTEYEVVILKTIYDMKQKEIAEYLNMPIGTVGWIYSKAIKKFKSLNERSAQDEKVY